MTRFDSPPEIVQMTTPPVPDQGYIKGPYPKADGLLYTLNPQGTESPIGGAPSIMRVAEAPTNLAANAWAAIGGWTVEASQGTGISYVPGNNYLTVVNAGWYRLTANTSFSTPSAVRYIMRLINGSNPDAGIISVTEGTGTGGSYPGLTAAATLYLPAFTQVRMFMYCTSAVITDAKRLTIESVGAAYQSVNPIPDTGWINFSYINGWQTYPGYRPCQYRKIGDLVYLRGLLQASVTIAGSTPATILPAGFRPTVTDLFGPMTAAGITDFRIDTNGLVFNQAATSAGNWITLSGIVFSTV